MDHLGVFCEFTYVHLCASISSSTMWEWLCIFNPLMSMKFITTCNASHHSRAHLQPINSVPAAPWYNREPWLASWRDLGERTSQLSTLSSPHTSLPMPGLSSLSISVFSSITFLTVGLAHPFHFWFYSSIYPSSCELTQINAYTWIQYIYTHTYTYTHYTHTHIHTHVYTYTHTYTNVHIYKYMYLQCIYTHITNIYIYTYIYYTHIYIYT